MTTALESSRSAVAKMKSLADGLPQIRSHSPLRNVAEPASPVSADRPAATASPHTKTKTTVVPEKRSSGSGAAAPKQSIPATASYNVKKLVRRKTVDEGYRA
eukprot:scaffold576132_cov24-Prasinocladus_malaysianus.AAC.1